MKKSPFLFIAFFFLSILSNAQSLKPFKSGFYPILKSSKTTNQNTTNTYIAEGNNMVSTMTMSMQTNYEIEPSKNGEQKVHIGMKINSGTLEMMGQTQAIPSTEQEEKSIIVINAKGNIDRIEMGTEALEKLKQSGINTVQIGKPLTFFILVPNEKKAGDKWIDSTYANDFMVTDYEYTSNEGNLAVLKYVSRIKFVNTTTQNGMEIRSDMEGTVTGTFKVNTENNFVVQNNADMNLEGRMEVNTREIPMSIKGTVTDINK